MEFRLNKIEPELRQKINDETREGKVHSKKDIRVNTDKNDKNKRENSKEYNQDSDEKFSLSKYVKKDKKITINAVKVESIEIEATVEKESNSKETYKGVFLDTRK